MNTTSLTTEKKKKQQKSKYSLMESICSEETGFVDSKILSQLCRKSSSVQGIQQFLSDHVIHDGADLPAGIDV